MDVEKEIMNREEMRLMRLEDRNTKLMAALRELENEALCLEEEARSHFRQGYETEDMRAKFKHFSRGDSKQGRMLGIRRALTLISAYCGED